MIVAAATWPRPGHATLSLQDVSALLRVANVALRGRIKSKVPGAPSGFSADAGFGRVFGATRMSNFKKVFRHDRSILEAIATRLEAIASRLSVCVLISGGSTRASSYLATW